MRRLLGFLLPFLVGLLPLLGGCSPRRPAMAEQLPQEEPVPEVGIIRSIDPKVLVLQLPGSDIPKVYSRSAETVVACNGSVVGWSALRRGQPIRLRSVQGVFGPPNVTVVEILSGPQAEAVRNEVLGQQEEGGASCP